MALMFPRTGSEKTVPVYTKPIRDSDEDDQAFLGRVETYEERRDITVTVKLVSREVARVWGHRWAAAISRDAKRQKDTESEFMTPEGVTEFVQIQRSILEAALVRIDGVIVGDVLLSTLTDTSQVIQHLDEIDLLAIVCTAITEAQTPTPSQVKH